MPPPSTLKKTHFQWMTDRARNRAYVSYSEYSGNSACSFDLGHEGYAASCNYGGELLQMTVPSKDYGILFARADFEYSLYLSIGRAQRERGGKATFGLKMPAFSEITEEEGPCFCLGDMIDRGTFNYRWPLNEYSLLVNQPNPGYLKRIPSDLTWYEERLRTGGVKEEVGTCAIMTFVKDGTLYQVLRLDGKCHPNAKDCDKATEIADIALEIVPPLRFQSFQTLKNKDGDKSDVFFKNLELSEDKSCVYMTGDLGKGTDVVWQASLSEYNIENGQRMDITLQEVSTQRDHCSKAPNDSSKPSPLDRVKSLPVYGVKLKRARITPNPGNTGNPGVPIGGSRVFVATFQLYESEKRPESEKKPELKAVRHLTPDQVIEFLGIKPGSPLATASVWQADFLQRQESMECISEFPEVNLVGRCLEKILGVDLVPATFPATGWDAEPLALVSNLFLKAQVDLEALFWKTRFLVKVDKLLSLIIKYNSRNDTQTQQLQDTEQEWPSIEKRWQQLPSSSKGSLVQVATTQRIQYAIGNIMAYLVRAFLEPHPKDHPLLPELDASGGDSKYYYVMLTMCYVIKHYPGIKWAWQHNLGETGKYWHLGLLGRPERLPSRELNPLASDRSVGAATKEKDSFLKWFHHESVAFLQSQDKTGHLIPEAWKKDEEKIEGLRFDAKTALIKRLSSAQPYRSEDEIIDRLAFLATELWPELADVGIIADRVIRRIEIREFTKTIQMCPSRREDGRHTGSPWEIHALCHHSRLAVSYRKLRGSSDESLLRGERDELEHFKRKFSPFLTAEVSLLPCWERSNYASRRGFLHSEATAVLSSTILDIFIYDLNRPSERVIDTKHQAAGGQVLNSPEQEGIQFSSAISSVNNREYAGEHISHLKRTQESATVEYLLALQLDALERIAPRKDPGARIDYLIFKPPQQHHTEDFFNSLDDTPLLYVAPHIKTMHIPRGIRRILSSGRFHYHDIKNLPAALRYTLMPHLRYPLTQQHEYFDYETLQQLRNAAEQALKKGNINKTEKVQFSPEVRSILGFQLTKLQWIRFLKALIHAKSTLKFKYKDISLNELTEGEVNAMKSFKIIDITACDPPSRLPPKPFPSEVKHLADSLIDQEVRHRILLAPTGQKLPADQLRLLCYVLHPELIDCFENYTMRVSKFVLQKQTSVAHITIQSWAFATWTKENIAAAHDDPFDTPGFIYDYLQDGPRKAFRDSKGAQYSDDMLPVMELKVSSIGISTNEFGDFSRCTVITDLIQEHKLEVLAETVENIWDSFVHQPQTGRFLVFSVILASICEQINKHYDKAIREFVEKFKFDNLTAEYLTDSTWLQSEMSEKRLQLSHWSLEALYKLSNTLAGTVSVIAQAKADLDMEIKCGPGKRSEELEKLCLTHQEPLERSFAELTAVQIKLERKVELNKRYTNALSNVLALRDSRASYRQSNTIQKLTYITIGCLPIGLSAALFAVPKDQNVLYPEMGLNWFIGIAAILFVAIFAVAMALDTILSGLENTKKYCKSNIWQRWTTSVVPERNPLVDQFLMPIWQRIRARIARLREAFTRRGAIPPSPPPGEGGQRRARGRGGGRGRRRITKNRDSVSPSISARSSDENTPGIKRVRTIEEVV